MHEAARELSALWGIGIAFDRVDCKVAQQRQWRSTQRLCHRDEDGTTCTVDRVKPGGLWVPSRVQGMAAGEVGLGEMWR